PIAVARFRVDGSPDFPRYVRFALPIGQPIRGRDRLSREIPDGANFRGSTDVAVASAGHSERPNVGYPAMVRKVHGVIAVRRMGYLAASSIHPPRRTIPGPPAKPVDER